MTKLNSSKFDQLKHVYAEMIAESMPYANLINLAINSIKQDIKSANADDLMSEIAKVYDQETLDGLMEIINLDDQQITEAK